MQACLFQIDAGGRKGPELPMVDGGLVSLLHRCHRGMSLFNMFLFLSLLLLYDHIIIIFPSFFLFHSAQYNCTSRLGVKHQVTFFSIATMKQTAANIFSLLRQCCMLCPCIDCMLVVWLWSALCVDCMLVVWLWSALCVDCMLVVWLWSALNVLPGQLTVSLELFL